MGRRHLGRQGALVATLALASVLGVVSPAAAATSSTTTQASPSTTTVGSVVTLSATVTCTADPSGGLGVTFFDGSDLLATVPVSVSGQATFATGFSTTGTHTITAAYNGNGACDASNSTTTVNVSQSTSTPGTTPCLLLCGGLGLINFGTGDINNNIGSNINNNSNNGNTIGSNNGSSSRHRHGGRTMASVPSGR